MWNSTRLVLIVLILNLYAFNSAAQSFTLAIEPDRDNTIFSENTAESNGSGSHIFSGKIQNGTAVRRALIRFDLSAIPAGAQIDSASLNLFVFRSARGTTVPHSFALHKLTSNWGEAGSNGNGSGAAAQSGDATWSQSFYPSTNWTGSGGDFETLASAITNAAYSDFPISKAVWESAQMVTDIENWRSAPSTNFGWMIIGDETINGSAKGFFSRETQSPYQPYRPKLNIYYSIPPVKSILINEVNPNKQWIELYNPIEGEMDVSGYAFQNGNQTALLSGLQILNGDLSLDSAEFVVLKWPNIGKVSGEIGLYNADTISGELIDYMQYGTAPQPHSDKAVLNDLWDNTANFLSGISDSTKSYSLKSNKVYYGGDDSSFADWLIQRETPSIINSICPDSISLNGKLVPASYSSSGTLEIKSSLEPSQKAIVTASDYILLTPLTNLKLGAGFTAQIGECVN